MTDLKRQFTFVVFLSFAAVGSPCQGQTSTPSNARVKVDSLQVYSEMRLSSRIVYTLKKGDAVAVDYQFRGAGENWCSIKLPAETARLGYVSCDTLERMESRSEPPSARDASSASASDQPAARIGVARPGASSLPIAPPAARRTSAYEEAANLVVREGVVDVVKLAELDAAARGGSAPAMTRAALAHYAAGNFELSRNSPDEAIEQYRAALGFAVRQPDVLLANLLSLAYVHLRRSEYSAALGYLDRGSRLAPDSVAVAQLSGWAYYGLNRLDEAVAEWQRAQRIHADPDVAELLEKAERDKETESAFREGSTTHFLLRYEGEATPQLSQEILSTLEVHYRTIQAELHFTPPEPIGVILYTQQTFRDITRAPSWAGASFDGRLRVPVQGLTSVSDALSQVLMHELTHSFIRQKTRGRCPQWLNEGLAQWMEGRRATDDAQILVSASERHSFPPLKNLEGSWTGFSSPAAQFAYAWSLAVVESIIANSGMWGIERLFENLATQPSVETALGTALQTNYADLERQALEYLRRTYLQ